MNKTTHDKDDSYQDKHVTEFEPKENGQQNIGIVNKFLSTNFAVRIENQQAEELIPYSLDQQIFEFKVIKEHKVFPTDNDLQTYPSVHLTSPQEWDPSVLDVLHSEDNGEPGWANDPTENFYLIQTVMHFMIVLTTTFYYTPNLINS